MGVKMHAAAALVGFVALVTGLALAWLPLGLRRGWRAVARVGRVR